MADDSASVVPVDGSLFDSLKGDDGRWSARDLIRPLGYDRWQHFIPAIERAQAACMNAGHAVEDNFTVDRKNAGSVGRTGVDYRLTRFAAYLVAMNGDPRKPEIASAQRYFAIKTRQAEVGTAGVALDPELQRIVDLTVQTQVIRNEQRRLAAEQERQSREIVELAARVDSVTQNTGWLSALGWAKMNGARSDTVTMSRLGRRATAILKSRGEQPAKEHNQRYGTVHMYPVDVIEQAARELGLL